jgi:transcriptional regulator with XRE-family HTH domain
MPMNGRMRNVCQMLGGARRISGMSLEYVARVVGILDPAILREVERGDRAPDLELLCNLATLYDLSIDALVGREPSASQRPAPEPQGTDMPTLHMTPELFAAITVYAQAHGRRVGDILLQAITWRIGLNREQEQRYFPEPEG